MAVTATSANLFVGIEGLGSRANRPDDAYFTPEWVTAAILPHLPVGGRLLEPSAGEGAILAAVRRCPVANPPIVTAVELNPGRAETLRSRCFGEVVEGDFLRFAAQTSRRFDLILGNPPYSLAQEFVEAALGLLAPGGTCAMLLRLAFLESERRRAFHLTHPCEVCVLPRRPSFTGHGTDSAAYAWFCWGPERANRWRVL